MYRVTYQDGDSEDMPWEAVKSLRGIYNVRDVKECEGIERQVELGREVEVRMSERTTR